jgi:serine protease Do
MKNNNYTKNELIAAGATGGAVSLIVTIITLLTFGNAPTLSTNTLANTSVRALDLSDPSIPTMEKKIVQAVAEANPAVVSIVIKEEFPVFERYYDDAVGDLFGEGESFRVPRIRERGTEKRETGGGSGFIISPDGYIVTNKHVVSADKADLLIFLNDGEEYTAEVKATDPLNDIAILKIEAQNLPYLTFGDSSSLMVGQTVIAIGNPLLEFSNSVSVGVVSGLSRSIVAGSPLGQSEQIEDVIQTDAAINPGNSGGPLLDINGKVIGVNVAVASAENIGFALPSNVVEEVVNSVKQYGKIIRPYLGVRYMIINDQVQERYDLNIDYGAYIIGGEIEDHPAVLPASPAEKAGIKKGDIILEFDGEKIDKDTTLAKLIRNKKVGDSVAVKYLSNGKERTAKIKLEAIPQ